MAIYRGKVVSSNEFGMYVEIAKLGIGMVFGPCESVIGPVDPDNFVLCVQVDGAKEDVVVIGRLFTEQIEPPAYEPAIVPGTTTQYYRGDKTWQSLNAASVVSTASGNVSATNVQSAITELDSEKEPVIAAGTTAQYWRGDKTWQTLPTSSGGGEPAITAGTTAQYWRGDKTFQALNGAAVANTPAGNIAATTVQAALNELDSEKQTLITAGTTGQYYRGDKTFQTLNPAAVGAEPSVTAGTTGQYYRGDKSWQTLNPTAVGAEPTVTAGTTAQYYRGDKTWQTHNAASVANTPAGTISSTTVQNALNELDGDVSGLLAYLTASTVQATTANGVSWVGNFGQYDAVNNALIYSRYGGMNQLAGAVRNITSAASMGGTTTIANMSGLTGWRNPPATTNETTGTLIGASPWSQIIRVFVDTAGLLRLQKLSQSETSPVTSWSIQAGEYFVFSLLWIT